MGKHRTSEERLQSINAKLTTEMQKLSELEKQRDALEKSIAEKKRKDRNHRLIQLGGVIEHYLGRDTTDDDIHLLSAFLEVQEWNGYFFTKAMNKGAAQRKAAQDLTGQEQSVGKKSTTELKNKQKSTEKNATSDPEEKAKSPEKKSATIETEAEESAEANELMAPVEAEKIATEKDAAGTEISLSQANP